MKKNYYYLAIAIFCTLSFANFSAKAQQTCFTISDSENKIYKFRLSDGTVLDSKSLSSLSSPEASTLNLAGDTLWILNQDELHFVKTTGTLSNTKVSGSNISSQTLTGSLGNKTISDFDAMSVDANGNIWAGTSSNDPCLLVVIDPSTGNVKEDYFGSGVDYLVVDNSNYSALRFDAMAFDPITNELYANLNGTSQNYDYLFKINTSNGAMTFVRQFNTISDVEGMSFDALGDMYVTTGANATESNDRNRLWKVDLVNGDVTEVFSLWGGDMETCDCIFGDPITAVELSGYVFFDQNEDTVFTSGIDMGSTGFLVNLYEDVNNNGIYDPGTDVFADSTRTYANGFYKFRLAYTSGTDNYVVVSDQNDLPDQTDYTTDNIETASFTAGRQIDANNNFGFATDSSDFINIINGTVFGDVNENGVLENMEYGVSGVKVYLYADENCDGSISYGEELLDSTVVGVDGKYCFLQPYIPGNGGGSGTETISKRISHSYDDAEEDNDGDMYRTSSDLDLAQYLVGLRFQSLNIPQGATITNAYIQFTGTETETGSASVKIYGQDANDASQFSSSDDDISDRSKTSEYVKWEFESWYNNVQYNSPDIKDVVQEIVNRNGWSSGNDMAFIIKKDNSGDRDAYTYDNNSSKAALLVITYETEEEETPSGTVCYATTIDEQTVPSGASMTTDNIETATFSSGGNTDNGNNFGLWGGALPVEWLSVKARYLGNVVEVRWATGSEDNNSHFIIERTHDGAHWEVIGEEGGAGFSTQINRYSFIDENPYGDVNYYRIKQVDFDGEFDYSKVVMVHGLVEEGGFKATIYPNPAKYNVVVEWNNVERPTQIVMKDLSGKSVALFNTENKFSIDINTTNYDTGIYFLEFIGDDFSKTEKLVIKH